MAGRRLRKSVIWLPLAMLVWVVGVVADSDVARAQRPKYATNDIRKIIDAPTLTPEGTAILDEYLNGFFLKIFTDPKRPNDLANLRNTIYRRIVRGAPKTRGRDHLNRRLLVEMGKIVLGKVKLPKPYEVAIRYNAMLLIAELNESESIGQINPLPAALPYLVGAFRTSRPELEFLKPAALIGLARHAEEGGIPKDKSAEIAQALLKLVTQEDPPPGRSASVHSYLRRSAGKVLAALGSPGTDNAVLKAFGSIAADSSARPMLRCETARFIGELKIPPKSNVNAQQLANALGYLTVEICGQEVGRASSREGVASRRLIMYVLDCNNRALQTLSGTVERGTDEWKFVNDLKSKVDSLYNTISDTEETSEQQVAPTVSAALPEIEGMLLAKPTPASLVAAGPEDAPTAPAGTN